MTLYEIQDNIRQAIEQGFNEETGEIFDASDLEALQIQRDEKIESIALYIKDLAAEAKAIKDERAALAKRQQTAENRAEWLKKYLAKCLDGQKFKTARVAISYRKSQTVELIDGFDINQLPHQFLREIAPEVDKTALKDALKEGKEIYGAYLQDRINTIIK
ncbi:MAG: siphovirus Gp157 family protein [Bacillus sp. (in: Bacteria)]|nr:siphovirus Gp157 family protein [Bacillus sp. (in: firmicutes)]